MDMIKVLLFSFFLTGLVVVMLAFGMPVWAIAITILVNTLIYAVIAKF